MDEQEFLTALQVDVARIFFDLEASGGYASRGT